jgi:hypothetical protein
MKRVIQIVLLVAIIVLGYFIIESIMTPIRFNQERDLREAATIEKLKDIRKAQVAYKSKYDRYTSDFDTLINFLQTDSFEIKKYIGNFDPDAMTLRQAIRAGFIREETTKVSVKDSLFKNDYPIADLKNVPFTDNKEIEMDATIIKSGGLNVPVFEAKIENDVLLHGMDRQLVVNYNDERMRKVKFAGLKVGSLVESNNNAGNWE